MKKGDFGLFHTNQYCVAGDRIKGLGVNLILEAVGALGSRLILHVRSVSEVMSLVQCYRHKEFSSQPYQSRYR